ncbi:APC family permease [Pseudonocardia sp. NPDC049635]|uniref:APC family permease n=1 Tax=Pseudonocardia sp. NPDC049635 TaxID=3155506 RepID=UPI0033EBD924
MTPGPDPGTPRPEGLSRASPGGGLSRRLGLGDAVMIGLGSMLGAGVFAAFGPAAAAAGSGLLIALVVAAVVAYANATSSARLAALHPESGGTYVYGRRRLGPTWGFVAGWGFVIGKTASCAAMALTLGAYAWPDQARPVAAAAVVVFTAVNYLGVSKTARLTRVLVVLTLVALAAVVAGALTRAGTSTAQLVDWFPHGPLGILQAAGLLFFAFAGYARIATLGEEVRDPARTIPRAIPLALGIVVAVYAVVGATALAAVGPAALAGSAAPLATAADADGGVLAAVVRTGGVVATAGVLLSLLAGIGRTTLAMARDRELPHHLAAVHPRYRVPHRAELVIGAVVLVLVSTFDLRTVIGFSSFAVLVYYAITNSAALTLHRPDDRRRSAVAFLGLAGCLVLAVTLPPASVITGAVVLLVGLVGRAVAARLHPRT